MGGLYYLILSVRAHNRRGDVEPIRTVLCPGLGTAVGRMPHFRCAIQVCVCACVCVCDEVRLLADEEGV